MSKPRTFLRLLTEPGPLAVLALTGAMLFGIMGPASAQFFNFGGFDRRPAPPRGIPGGQPPGPPQQGGFFSPFGDPNQQQPPPVVDSSRAPPPAKRLNPAPIEKNVVVMGDAMADWLAYGLEDALADTPELGVVRKANRLSGLLKYQPKGEPSDWASAAKQILATEKADVIVVMLGLNDRVPMREPVTEKKDDKKDKKADAKANSKNAKKDEKKDDKAKPKDAAETPAAKPDDEKPSTSASNKPSTDAADDDDGPASIVAPETAPRSANGMYNFRDERWVELYSKKISEMITVLKSKGVPVLWVGLPAVRGQKAMADVLFLDSLYRDAAGKAGITYVDVWDGFVDEAGRFMQQGPDFDGQTRRLRSYDGVYFTKAGAVKLARFTEREITRLLAARTLVSLPSELQSPETNIRPSVSGPRPLVGPMVPLVASNVGTTELLGGAGTRPASVDALAARTLVKGEPLDVPAGRADDYSWPRREIGALDAPAGDPNVATVGPNGSIVKPLPKPVAVRPPGQGPADPSRPQPQGGAQIFQPGAPRPPAPNGAPRPQATIAPGFFTR
ncbi:MAG: DUF459 domain-containing protein [Afipia sp.]|jgi:hypothetical protein|nr:DUF459 domain-containing protein [Afipia sp.]